METEDPKRFRSRSRSRHPSPRHSRRGNGTADSRQRPAGAQGKDRGRMPEVGWRALLHPLRMLQPEPKPKPPPQPQQVREWFQRQPAQASRGLFRPRKPRGKAPEVWWHALRLPLRLLQPKPKPKPRDVRESEREMEGSWKHFTPRVINAAVCYPPDGSSLCGSQLRPAGARPTQGNLEARCQTNRPASVMTAKGK